MFQPTKQQQELIDRINGLKKEKNAVILAHNYQRPEIFPAADFIGDSYGLSKKAAETTADTIVFCGVHFMAETAKILNPGKKVLLPNINAGCVMADMITADELRKKKAELGGEYKVVSYVNTTAEIKAESDVCCTSANAEKIVNAVQGDKILFVPDKNLAHYVAKQTGKTIVPWPGFCYVHSQIRPAAIQKARKDHPAAQVVAHPECAPEVVEMADAVKSTSGMIDYCKASPATEFVLATEPGMVFLMERECPDKSFYAPHGTPLCFNMKQNTLENVLDSLEKGQHEITVPKAISEKARRALDEMMRIGK